MIFLAILGLLLTITVAALAFGAMLVGIDEDSVTGTLAPLVVMVFLIALAIWQPVYWFTGVA